ncbi:formate dehydrogenase accessory sulfurtransferase FdhD [Tellurirhabdus bombi]|uniref:formate dehydrogenase accessory sulfurtransferase FdhD n=1 Tax=Tellurirhabdus bombi TaxID=2907205 RepID=UPI001F3C62D1|nr:formate dehydrogenase accessory sulfurtransferase FdhD [Tellurirhabdus bombi]
MLSVAPTKVWRVESDGTHEQPDLLAVEEPLQIRLGYGPVDNRQQRPLVITMRTPGHDEELALGYLFAEGIIRAPTDVLSCRYCVSDATKQTNDLRVELHPNVVVDWEKLERTGLSSAACGMCGKTSIEAVQAVGAATITSSLSISPETIYTLPERLRESQRAFAYTGGMHAAALFDEAGQIRLVREDIGRHNALDKLIGAAFWQGWLPLSLSGVLVSGRVGFELVQKCWMAGVPLLAAIGAPSSLAVEMAGEAGMTLLGFVRENRYNNYSPIPDAKNAVRV